MKYEIYTPPTCTSRIVSSLYSVGVIISLAAPDSFDEMVAGEHTQQQTHQRQKHWERERGGERERGRGRGGEGEEFTIYPNKKYHFRSMYMYVSDCTMGVNYSVQSA